MGKKKTAPARDEKRAAADYYRLNTQAVEDLVTADESNSPPVSEEELYRYRSGGKKKMPRWLKIVLIKAWFMAATSFFFIWGLGVILPNIIDQIVITGVAMGFVIDILLNNLLRFMEESPGQNSPWIFVGVKGFFSLPLNILYALVLMFLVVQTYEVINGLLILLFSFPEGTVPLGVEPILFGLFTMGWDMLFLLMKRTMKQIVADAKATARR
ncbi:MAG: hypothetical protein IJE07_11615 [Clostridia bacterium]|nr:hypothetical protein [Clostridia bacterium]